jgi:hypothetical protein
MSDLKSLNEYYSSVDKNLLENLSKNNNIRNLINLSSKSELYIFNKKNKKWQLKSKDKLLKECNQIKKKEIKESSVMLSNLAKLTNNNEYNSVSTIYNKLQSKIADIDKIVNCINHIDSSSESINQDFFKPNIVSFDEIPINIHKKESSINLNLQIDSKSESSCCENYIECYGNC